VTPEHEARKRQRKAIEKQQAIEDRITGMLIRRGVAVDSIESTKKKIAVRLSALYKATGHIRWRDVELVAKIVIKE
jgi:hypothetical protein